MYSTQHSQLVFLFLYKTQTRSIISTDSCKLIQPWWLLEFMSMNRTSSVTQTHAHAHTIASWLCNCNTLSIYLCPILNIYLLSFIIVVVKRLDDGTRLQKGKQHSFQVFTVAYLPPLSVQDSNKNTKVNNDWTKNMFQKQEIGNKHLRS